MQEIDFTANDHLSYGMSFLNQIMVNECKVTCTEAMDLFVLIGGNSSFFVQGNIHLN